MRLKVLIAGGGTGGHVFPALNLARAIEKRWPSELLFVGARRGIESEKIPKAGYAIRLIPVTGLHRRLTLKNIMFPINVMRSQWMCHKIIKSFAPHVAIGTGGYVMGPALRSALAKNVPVVIQEQNSFPGITTRLLAKKAAAVFLAYERAANHLHPLTKAVLTGNPVNLEPVTETTQQIRNQFHISSQKKIILVFGGSQGAASINRGIWSMLEHKQWPDQFHLLWQTGKRQWADYRDRVKSLNIDATVLPFIEHMNKAYTISEFAVCRAGAMTISELAAAGLPAIFVPLAHAAANHQYKNARAITEKGGGLIADDDVNLNENLQTCVHNLAYNEHLVQRMRESMGKLHHGDSANRIIDYIAELDGIKDIIEQIEHKSPENDEKTNQ
ncbi:MAG: undecaprenyldiphospho-muramoylpentapeptide beta-N-acetylglucosaminyltransferase [Caldithrix sp.]|nr:undecaprenyldiphospho-muramoylpentapeptide beta-N-acetylglucosaminyltransferase [Caldithrix sp.]